MPPLTLSPHPLPNIPRERERDLEEDAWHCDMVWCGAVQCNALWGGMGPGFVVQAKHVKNPFNCSSGSSCMLLFYNFLLIFFFLERVYTVLSCFSETLARLTTLAETPLFHEKSAIKRSYLDSVRHLQLTAHTWTFSSARKCMRNWAHACTMINWHPN